MAREFLQNLMNDKYELSDDEMFKELNEESVKKYFKIGTKDGDEYNPYTGMIKQEAENKYKVTISNDEGRIVNTRICTSKTEANFWLTVYVENAVSFLEKWDSDTVSKREHETRPPEGMSKNSKQLRKNARKKVLSETLSRICSSLIWLLIMSIVIAIGDFLSLQHVKINDIKKFGTIIYGDEAVYYCTYMDDNDDFGVLKVHSNDAFRDESGNDITWEVLLDNSEEMITFTKPLNICARKTRTPDIIQEEITANYGEKGIGAVYDTYLDVEYAAATNDFILIDVFMVLLPTIIEVFIVLFPFVLIAVLIWIMFKRKNHTLENEDVDFDTEDANVTKIKHDKNKMSGKQVQLPIIKNPHDLLAAEYVYPVITFGNYKQEPIEWFVLEDNSSEMLLLSKYIIDMIGCLHDFYLAPRKFYWKNSCMKKWLNDYFLLTAFDEAERKRLINDAEIGTAFFLSESEVVNYLSNKRELLADATSFAETKAEEPLTYCPHRVKKDGFYTWWTRDLNQDTYYGRVNGFCTVTAYGFGYDNSYYEYKMGAEIDIQLGCRPAVWLKKSESTNRSTD